MIFKKISQIYILLAFLKLNNGSYGVDVKCVNAIGPKYILSYKKSLKWLPLEQISLPLK